MKTIIEIKKDASHKDLAGALSAIFQSKGKDITLTLPKRIAINCDLGIGILVINLISTLLKLQKNTHITLKSPYAEMSQFEYENLYGLFSHLFFQNIINKQNIKIRKNELATRYLKEMFTGNYEEIILKNKISKSLELLSIQGTEYEYPSNIFTAKYEGGKRIVKNRDDIETEIHKILSCFKPINASKIHKSTPYLSNLIIGSLATLTQELFKNIEEHAKADHNGNMYADNIPFGMRLQHTKFDEEQLLSNMKDLWPPEFLNYLKNNNTNTVIKRYIPIFELSIFDSGPGLARKWLKQDFNQFSILDEEEATKKCFNKHATTKNDPSRYGNGLSEVLGCVSRQRGVIHIRTGRLLLIKAFHNDTNDKASINWKIIRFDNSPIDGTIISIFLPFAN